VGAPGWLRGGRCCGWRAAVRKARHALADDYTDREHGWNKCERFGNGQFEPAGLDGGVDAVGERIGGLGVRVGLYACRADDHSSIRHDEQVSDAEVEPEGEPIPLGSFVATAKLRESVSVRDTVSKPSPSVTRVPKSSLV
jgi:hypothetical protein